MHGLRELLEKESLTQRERNHLAEQLVQIQLMAMDASEFLGVTGATFKQRVRFMNSLDIFTTGMTVNSLGRGVQFFNPKAGGHMAFVGLINGTHGEFRIGVDDQLAVENTETTFSIRRDPASPSDTNQFNFNLPDAGAGATKVTIGGEMEIWAGAQAATDGRTTVFNEMGRNIDFRVEGDNDPDMIHGDASADAVGIGTATPAAKLHVDQTSTSGAKPVLLLDQADVDEDYFKIIGTSDTSSDRALVDAADFTTPGAIVGWLKVNVQDDQATNPITDGDYYIPFYSAPTA
ncbi:MAG: hypothetical protein IIA89_13395 [Chloroflexi bacterium]|nr:hypothetical protein [Chloroflexota bacterium]